MSTKVLAVDADRVSEGSSPNRFSYRAAAPQSKQLTGPPSPKAFDDQVPKTSHDSDHRSDPIYQGGDQSTADAQSALDRDQSRISNPFGSQHQYDWSEVAYLFEHGEIPEELAAITDPLEYNYLLVRLRKEFNEKHKSNYLKYMNLQLPYHSRRDEVGGTVTDEDWENFVTRLEGLITRVKKRRARIVRRRKKRGKKKFPRKTLFKPQKRIAPANDPLWREIFIDRHSDSESESEGAGEDMLEAYRAVCKEKGVPDAARIPKSQERGLKSARVELANREKEDDIRFPPVRHPSMHPMERP